MKDEENIENARSGLEAKFHLRTLSILHSSRGSCGPWKTLQVQRDKGSLVAAQIKVNSFRRKGVFTEIDPSKIPGIR